jgi:ABC-type nitrate/sulfonate/bicarbonate transport system substrate-binding protein
VTDVFIPLYAAEDLGIAKANGISFQFVPVESGSALLTSVVAGVTPFSTVPISTAAEALQHGTNIETFAVAQPLGAGFILEAKAGSGITSVGQLSGKSICVSQSGSETDVYGSYTNTVNHLGASIVPVGASGQEPSLLSGKSAACVEAAPQSYQLLSKHEAVELVNYGTTAPIYGTWIAQKGYAESHKTLTTQVLKTWYEAMARLKASPSLAERELAKWNGESASVAHSEWASMLAIAPTTGALTMSQINETYKVLQASGATGLPAASSLASSEFAGVSG